MIIVTLVATLAASMVWQQWRAVQVETSERARIQAAWVLSGALDFARRILREDKALYTGLTEPWATPLAESRLSTFLAADNANADDGPEAFLSGYITDAQGRYNVTNLALPGDNGKWELKTMTELCQTAQVDVGIAQRLASGMTQAVNAQASSSSAPLRPTTVAQLAWLGIDADSLKALEPYIVVLPDFTNLNVNTASKEVLAAVAQIDQNKAGALVATALKTPFTSLATFPLQPGTTPTHAKLDTVSKYFEVRGRIRLADHVLIQKSLVHKEPDRSIRVIQTERIASLEQLGS